VAELFLRFLRGDGLKEVCTRIFAKLNKRQKKAKNVPILQET
jgi:hypothetical protein